MIVKFKCNQFPNGVMAGVKFKEGFAEIDSIDTNLMNELMGNPFVECCTVIDGALSRVISEEPVPYSTYRNRLIRKTKVELIKVAESVGVKIADQSLTIPFIMDKILEVKYPEEHKKVGEE
jgi:hypothetical protein